MSVDAVFGLCRKKSAGNSVRGPLSGMSVFESQDEVNTFIDLQGHSRHSQSEVYTCTYICMCPNQYWDKYTALFIKQMNVYK